MSGGEAPHGKGKASEKSQENQTLKKAATSVAKFFQNPIKVPVSRLLGLAAHAGARRQRDRGCCAVPQRDKPPERPPSFNPEEHISEKVGGFTLAGAERTRTRVLPAGCPRRAERAPPAP